ncbi:YadA-like family protein [Megamonas hypermegale]|uniref:YadA-like family protein n=1 Tax=Megamonas hypermegale TaxID=158847 RepID=UPI0026E9AFDE|nr:YadA-like family protein [Megamonas hypermegale]
MAKNKKAQILAAVMCAATVAGVSPAISSAATVPDTTNAEYDFSDNGLKITLGDGSSIAFRPENNDLEYPAGLNVNADMTIVGQHDFKIENGTFTVGNNAFKVWNTGGVEMKGNLNVGEDKFYVDAKTGNLTIKKDEGNDQATKTDVKAGYVGITNKNGTEVFAVDYSGNMVLRDTDEAIQTDVKPGYIKISKNGEETFAVDSSGAVRAANGEFGVNATGDVTANSINAANGRFTVSEDGSTYIRNDRSQLQVRDDLVGLNYGNNAVIVNADGVGITGNLTADNGLKVGLIDYDENGNAIYGTEINEDGSFSTANGNFTVDEDGNINAINNTTAGFMTGDHFAGMTANGNGISVSNEGIDFYTNGTGNSVHMDRLGGTTFKNSIDNTATTINGGTISTDKILVDGIDVVDTFNGFEKAGIIPGTVGDNTFGSIAMGDHSLVLANQSIAIGAGSIINANAYSSVALGANAGVYAANSVALGADSTANRENTVSVGSKNHERQITNVAAGTEDTDAVNVAQLNEVKDSIATTNEAVGGIERVDSDNDGKLDTTVIEDNTSISKDGLETSGSLVSENASGKTEINGGKLTVTGPNGGSTTISGDSISTGHIVTDSITTGSITIGDPTQGGIHLGDTGALSGNIKDEDSDFTYSNTADGYTSVAKDNNGNKAQTSVGADSISNAVSDINGNRAETNLTKDGFAVTTNTMNEQGELTSSTATITGSDVVINSNTDNEIKLSDMGQVSNLNKELKENSDGTLVGAINAESAMRQQLSGRVDGLESRVGSLEDRMGDVEDRIDKVGAMAAAIANLRTMGYDPEAPTEIAVGVGQYESETGLALGVFHYPNQDFMLSASISTSGDEVMGGIGATWKIGRKSSAEKARSVEEKRVAKAEEMQEMAKAEKVKAQRERHAQMLAEREAAK